MKIERVNENQIRCTLTKEDLADRELKISELAYGTEKAKTLFRDMMQQASFEFGFDAEDIPLMIEAIPLSDCIVLVITKVEDPEELDTRFSKFAPSVHTKDVEGGDSPGILQGADDILDIFRKLQESRESLMAAAGQTDSGQPAPLREKHRKKEEVPNVTLNPVSITKTYSFDNLDDVIRLSHILNGSFDGASDLFKDPAAGYTLVLDQGTQSPESFNKVCNMASEYGREIPTTPGSHSFLMEHSEVLVSGKALSSMRELYAD